MFRKKKLYKIVYQKVATYTVIIDARDECHAIKQFRNMMDDTLYSIVSFEEYEFGRG